MLLAAAAGRRVHWCCARRGGPRRPRRWGTRLLRVEPTDELTQAHTPAEFAAMLEESAAEGELEAAEHDLLSGALGFLGVRRGRRDGATGPAGDRAVDGHGGRGRGAGAPLRPLPGAGGRPRAGRRHRVPARQGPAAAYRRTCRDDLLPPGLVRVALRVGPDERLPDVLPRMRRARRHVAVVAEGERESVLGLVTLEDILEAIVGDIRDETDRGDSGRAAGGEHGDGATGADRVGRQLATRPARRCCRTGPAGAGRGGGRAPAVRRRVPGDLGRFTVGGRRTAGDGDAGRCSVSARRRSAPADGDGGRGALLRAAAAAGVPVPAVVADRRRR